MNISYRQVIVIGSGVSGLCLGALLAGRGAAVTVLEANPSLIGGHARTLKINGLSFCAGPQYVWSFGKDQIGARLLKYLGIEELVPFTSLDPEGFERFVVEGQDPIDVPMGLDNFKTVLCNRFPKEKSAIEIFFSRIKYLFRAAQFLHDNGTFLKGGWAMQKAVALSSSFSVSEKLALLRMSRWTLEQLFEHCNLSSDLRKFLYGHGGIFAESPDSISVGIYAAATGYYHQGACLPVKGFESLINALAGKIREAGGEILTGKKVSQLTRAGGRILTANCQDGSEYGGDLIISSASPRMTARMIDNAVAEQFKYPASNSLLGCFIGFSDLQGISDSLRGRNYWWQSAVKPIDYQNPDMTAEPAMLYVGSPSANCSLEGNTRKLQSLVVFAPGSFRQSLDANYRGEEFYSDFKAKIAEVVQTALETKLFPGIKSKIEFCQVMTPWDIYSDLQSEKGNVYGRRLDVKTTLETLPKIADASNLYLASASCSSPGVATCFQTARLLYQQITGEKI